MTALGFNEFYERRALPILQLVSFKVKCEVSEVVILRSTVQTMEAIKSVITGQPKDPFKQESYLKDADNQEPVQPTVSGDVNRQISAYNFETKQDAKLQNPIDLKVKEAAGKAMASGLKGDWFPGPS